MHSLVEPKDFGTLRLKRSGSLNQCPMLYHCSKHVFKAAFNPGFNVFIFVLFRFYLFLSPCVILSVVFIFLTGDNPL